MNELQTMDTSLYDDHCYTHTSSAMNTCESNKNLNSPTTSAESSTTTTSATLKRPTAVPLNSNNFNNNDSKNIKELKKNLTLDFTSPESAKKTLATPDIIRFFQLASPELEKFITQGVVQVTTPTPTNFLFPKNVTAAQEQYARGFIDALNHLHTLNNFSPGATLLSPGFVASSLAGNSAAAAAAVAAISSSAAETLNSSSTTTSSGSSKAASTSSAQDLSPVTSSSLKLFTSGGLAQTDLNNFLSSFEKFSPRSIWMILKTIMGTVGFPINMNMNSQAFQAALQSMQPGAAAASMGIPAAMAFFNLPTAASKQQEATSLINLTEDRPPSQSAEPGSMEFTNLTGVGVSVAPGPSIASTAPQFSLDQNPQVSNSITVISPTSRIPRVVHVKSEPDQAVPNVNLQIDGPFSNPRPATDSVVTGASGGSAVGSVLDMKQQELLKLERKRHRNRVAASKCRKRKLEKISDLEKEVREQETTKKFLLDETEGLKAEIDRLRANLESHRAGGCVLNSNNIATTVVTRNVISLRK